MSVRSAPARRRDLRRYPGFGMLTWVCMVFLYAPILVMAIYSFNKIRSITTWGGFSFDWYAKAIGNAAIQQATVNSLVVAVIASSMATLFATAAALAMVRGRRFRGQEMAFSLINLPLLVPEIISAVATLLFFVAIGITLGMTSVMLAHVVFCIPFAYLPIAARLEGIEPMYEEAARDLYADGWQAFRYVTLPLLFPGVIAGFMLAFIISLDDFIITNMVTGPGATTLPLAIYGMVRTGLTPEINAISTLLLGVSMLFVTLSYLIGRKGGRA
jgi:spermidine/putrescine transport system permease protein